jgi:hypothetical protein
VKGEGMNTMITMNTVRPSLKLGLLAPLALGCLAMAPHARADSILLAQTTLVSGSQSTVDSFTTPGAGTVTVDLQSLDWPTSLNALSFSATSANQVLASLNATGLTGDVATFNVGSAGTYYAHILATAGGALDLGIYSLNMSFSPTGTPTVGLPASGWMLLTGMFVLAGLVRAMRPLELMGTAEA